MTNEKQDCPGCNGKGEVEGFQDKWSDRSGHYTVPRMVECETCDGSGEVPSLEAFLKAQREFTEEYADFLDTTSEAVTWLLDGLIIEILQGGHDV